MRGLVTARRAEPLLRVGKRASEFTPRKGTRPGSEADGLIAALAVMLDFRDQFHCLLTESNTELLWSIRMIVCHFCLG